MCSLRGTLIFITQVNYYQYYCVKSLVSFSGEFQLPLNSVDLAGPIEEWKDLAPVDDGSNQYLGDLCLSLRSIKKVNST